MRYAALAVLVALVALAPVLGCEVGLGRGAAAGESAAREAHDDRLSEVELSRVAPGVFVHTSFHELADVGVFPSNGLLLCGAGEGVLVDTAWGEGPTARLLDEAQKQRCPVRHAIFTHFHDDRTGGLPTLFARGVRVHATDDTTRRLAHPGFAPERVTPPETLTLAGFTLEIFYPGPAHAPDNVVVHLAAQRLLFGGCMVKAASAKSLGNVGDASVAEWPLAIAQVDARYAAVTSVVVPGHGAPGGIELLAHTARLLAAAKAPAPSR